MLRISPNYPLVTSAEAKAEELRKKILKNNNNHFSFNSLTHALNRANKFSCYTLSSFLINNKENHSSASSPTTPNHIANSGPGLSFVSRQQQISKLKNSNTMGSIRRYDPKNVQKIVLDWCMEQTKNYPVS